MEFELPEEIRLKWTTAGGLLCRADAWDVSASARNLAVAGSPTVRGGSFISLSDIASRVAGVRAWAAQQSPQQERAAYQINMAQLEGRQAIAREEQSGFDAVARLLASQGACVASYNALVSSEDTGRKGIQQEVADFMAFAANKEPQWRRLAMNKTVLKNHSTVCLDELRRMYQEEFTRVTDTLYAMSLQERDDRDVAYVRQLQREDQAKDAELAMQYERERIRQEKEQEERRLANLAAERERQRQQNNQYGGGYPSYQGSNQNNQGYNNNQYSNNSNFAMPPANLYGGGAGYGGGYSYNSGPSAGATYGYR